MATKTSHREYLQSAHWKAKRAEAIEWYCGECNRCQMPRWLAEIVYDQDLHVHHRTYANKGAETMADLEVLCARCHEVETFGRSELRQPKRALCEACLGAHWDYRSHYCNVCEAVRNGYSNAMSALESNWQMAVSELAVLAVYEKISEHELRQYLDEGISVLRAARDRMAAKEAK